MFSFSARRKLRVLYGFIIAVYCNDVSASGIRRTVSGYCDPHYMLATVVACAALLLVSLSMCWVLTLWMNVESKTCFEDHVQTKLSFDAMLCMWDACAYTCVCLVFGASEDILGVVSRASSTSTPTPHLGIGPLRGRKLAKYLSWLASES